LIRSGALIAVSIFVFGFALPARADQAGADTSGANGGYPTAARADYVVACMATNGGTQLALQRCSCAIDVIASLLPYDRYENAATVLSMRQSPGGGYLVEQFHTAVANEMVRDLNEAQAEAEVRCF
jgi:hypothetical protein